MVVVGSRWFFVFRGFVTTFFLPFVFVRTRNDVSDRRAHYGRVVEAFTLISCALLGLNWWSSTSGLRLLSGVNLLVVGARARFSGRPRLSRSNAKFCLAMLDIARWMSAPHSRPSLGLAFKTITRLRAGAELFSAR